MSDNAPPGGGPGATVIATTVPGGTPAPAPVVAPANPPASPPAPATVTPPANAPDDALNLEPVVNQPPASAENVDYGDNGLNIAADYFINTCGIDRNDPALEQAAKGQFHLLEAKLQVLGDKAKGSGPMLELAKESLGRITAKAQEKYNATVKIVRDAAGGEENWKAVQAWARTNLTPEQQAEARAAFEQGGLVAQAMSIHLTTQASKSAAVTLTGAEVTTPGAPASQLHAAPPLSGEEYRAEYKKLLQKYGVAGVAHSAELKALNARGIRK